VPLTLKVMVDGLGTRVLGIDDTTRASTTGTTFTAGTLALG